LLGVWIVLLLLIVIVDNRLLLRLQFAMQFTNFVRHAVAMQQHYLVIFETFNLTHSLSHKIVFEVFQPM